MSEEQGCGFPSGGLAALRRMLALNGMSERELREVVVGHPTLSRTWTRAV